ncbi:TPA: hypothetical protein ACH3X2_007819 [Trebouxia sp. C0005]
MNSAEQKALRELQQYASKLGSKNELSGWSVRTGRQGVYYQHEGRSLSFQTLGAAKVAVQALSQDGHSSTNTAIVPQEDDDGNDEDEEGDELLNLCSSLDGVIGQLQKHMNTLQSYQRQPYESTETSWAVQSKIEDMYDICAYVHVDKTRLTLTQEDTLLQRSTKLRCQLLLATCAVFAQKLLHRASYTSGYRQHCMHTLMQELRHTGADTPALAMLVEPLLPRAWRKELDKQKILKGDVDTDLFAISIGERDIAQASEEEGSPLQGDSIVLEGPEMATLKVAKISDALDFVPVCKREVVEHTIAHAIGQGLDSLMECCKVFENKYANRKYHQAWLRALKQAILGGDSAEQESEKHLLQEG